MQKIWILTDGRMGSVNQLLGIAEALDQPVERKEIKYTHWIKLPNFLRGSSLIGVTPESKEQLKAPWPDVVISATRRSFPVSLYIKKKSGGKTKIVHIMNPDNFLKAKDADLLVLPQHDKKPFYTKNVMRILGAANRVTPNRLKTERTKWEKTFSTYRRPHLSVIVGGATKDRPFTDEMAHLLAKQINDVPADSILLTTSPRTPKSVTDILQRSLNQKPIYFYVWDKNTENPYFGLLAYADTIVVTGDSISMCSECCSTGVPVLVFAPDGMIGPKHKKFLNDLYRNNYASPLGDPILRHYECFPNPADEIARAVKKWG